MNVRPDVEPNRHRLPSLGCGMELDHTLKSMESRPQPFSCPASTSLTISFGASHASPGRIFPRVTQLTSVPSKGDRQRTCRVLPDTSVSDLKNPSVELN